MIGGKWMGMGCRDPMTTAAGIEKTMGRMTASGVMPPADGLRAALRWDAVGRQEDHQPVHEGPHGDLGELLCASEADLRQRARQPEEQKDLRGSELPAAEEECPGDEHGDEDHHAVKRDHVQVIG